MRVTRSGYRRLRCLSMQELTLRKRIPAAPEAVWDVFTDHVGYMRWAGVKEVVLRQEGHPAPNGLGAIRVIRSGGIAIEEEVTAFEPPKRMEYRVVSGLPVRDHLGEVLFESVDGGTELTWKVRFRPRIPGTGWLLGRAVRLGLSQMLDRLAQVDFPA